MAWIVGRYFGEGVADFKYYGIPCKPLPTVVTLWLNEPLEVPVAIDGLVLISAGTLSGFEFGPGTLNPYEQFQHLAPSQVIQHGVFVFDGHFDIPLAAGLNHVQQAQNLLAAKQLEPALAEAQAAVTLAPNSVDTQLALGDVLAAMGQTQPARSAYQKALSLARTIEPDFQIRRLPGIEQRIASLRQ